jgi:hypothetical protein
LALLLLGTRVGGAILVAAEIAIGRPLAYTNAGTGFVFGPPLDTGYSFALGVLPLIILLVARRMKEHRKVHGTLSKSNLARTVPRAALPQNRTQRTTPSGKERISRLFIGSYGRNLLMDPSRSQPRNNTARPGFDRIPAYSGTVFNSYRTGYVA